MALCCLHFDLFDESTCKGRKSVIYILPPFQSYRTEFAGSEAAMVIVMSFIFKGSEKVKKLLPYI